jgi:pimeloyl-ACP methyl ester carboxylesterase
VEAPDRALSTGRVYLIVPDLRGHGESDSPPEFTIQDSAADIAARLREKEEPNPAVCGVCLGGVVAQRLVLDHPDMVRCHILANTFSSVHGPIASLNARAGEIGLSVLLPGPNKWYL